MFSLNDSMRYLLYNRPTDMRKSFHTLSGIITDAMGQDPSNGNVYIFINRAGKAIEYTYTLLPRLSRYVNDGRIEIDDNRIENAIRPLALGRKNYLFCGNDASAYRAAIVYSLIATCKSAEVDPRIWMEDVLSKIPYYERDEKNMEELLPRNWAKSNQTCSE